MPRMLYNLRTPARLLAIALVFMLLASCIPSGGKGLDLPSTPSILGDPGWLLVKEAYATLRARPGAKSAEAGHLRNGLILEIRGRAYAEGSQGDTAVLWYLVTSDDGSGWISSAACEVFASKEQALRSLGKAPQG